MYPLFSNVFGPSLQMRIDKPYWFENRFIQYILRDNDWIEEQEELMKNSDIEKVENWNRIFSDLNAASPYYDLEIFDTLAEVRLIHWARENGYTDIGKIIPSNEPTPDFRMNKNGEVIIAEVKHSRWRDYLPDFIEDRLNGLILETGYLSRFGISVYTSDMYGQMREFFLETRRGCELGYRDVIREELTEEWLKQMECNLDKNPNFYKEIILNLFIMQRDDFPGVRVGLFGPLKNEKDAAKLMLKKLCGNLMKALKQIESFIDANSTIDIYSRALVFLSGTDSWSKEWDNMWEMLEHNEGTVWEKVKAINHKASEMTRLPFELIVGKDKKEPTTIAGRPATKRLLEYISFPWSLAELENM
ncbi:MAG: hypothetical protein A2158_04160 [Chloroflexi bacterium RBG_13_46_14]|nr:MAG: hypothetical protein A2158_04160 [Chloroflexi bacterium RBG_13_46_14]